MIDTGLTSFMLLATSLVMLMTPGLAFFYGGLACKKNILNVMIQSFVSMGWTSVLWFIFGYSLCFSGGEGGIIGNLDKAFYHGVHPDTLYSADKRFPEIVFIAYQMMFAIITPALITGAFANRITFKAYFIFLTFWQILVYYPFVHMIWGNGLLAKWGVLDFAGGIVVHMSAGWAALAGAIFLGKRKNQKTSPARITYVLLGTGLLWFGWFGFNAGSALGANGLAVQALSTTTIAAAAASMAWVFWDKILGHKISAKGACIGAVVGLVAITPAAGYVSMPHAIFIGIVSSIISNIVVINFPKGKIDDALDVFGCHGVGGMIGMLLTAVFASKAINPAIENQGLFFGETKLFINHVIVLLIVSAFSFGMSYFLFYVVNKITPLRVSTEKEELGLDITQHGEFL